MQEASFFFCLSGPSLVAKPWHIFPAPRVSSLVKLPTVPETLSFAGLEIVVGFQPCLVREAVIYVLAEFVR